jgi:non-heme chloroperoxidase
MTAPANGQAIAHPGEARRFTVPTADRHTLSAQAWGNPAAPAIVFVHGFGQCHLSWLPQLRSKLAQDFHLITYDLRGHGESAKPLDRASYHTNRLWADDLLAVMDGAGVQRAVLVAWSFGGRTALDVLDLYGEDRFAGLNLIGANILDAPEFRGTGSLPLRPLMASDDLSVSIPAVRAFLRLCFTILPDGDTLEEILAYNMVVPPSVRGMLHGRTLQPESMLAALKLPVLVTIGERDALAPLAGARRVAAIIKGADLSVYDGIGHSPFYEAADRFNAELHAFATRAFAGWSQS